MLRASLKAMVCVCALSSVFGRRRGEACIGAIKDGIGDHGQHLRRGLSASEFRALNRQRRGGRQADDFVIDDQRLGIGMGDETAGLVVFHLSPCPPVILSGSGSIAKGMYCNAPSATITSRLLPS